MTQYDTLNVKLSNSRFNKLKSATKSGTGVTLNLSKNIICDSNDRNYFPHKLSLTNTQVWRLRKAFSNGLSAHLTSSKTQLHKIGQSGGFLCSFLRLLLKSGLPLIGNVLKPLAKSVLIPLGLAAAASATNAAVHKKMFGSGFTTIIFNEEINDVMKIVKSY